MLEAQWAVFEKAFAGAPKPKRNGEIITYVDPDTQESKVLYEWSPSGASKALELLMRHRWMLSDRYQVEHPDVVYALDLGDSLRGGEDSPDESVL